MYTFLHSHMTHTTIPSVKGQVTIPALIRKKYKISQRTPILVTDNGKGTLTLKIMQLTEPDDVTFYENEKGFGLTFKKGIDPDQLIKAIQEIDG